MAIAARSNIIKHLHPHLWMRSYGSSIFRAAVMIALSIGVIGAPREVRADAARDFIVSCSYGVLAGTLVGAATLAFSDRPGDNLNKVARGASLGLYAGILLGAYVVYGVPGEDEDAAAQLNRTSLDGVPGLAPEKNLTLTQTHYQLPALQMYPLIGERGIEGAAANLRVLSF
jgi:hypothetical protein